MDRDEIPGGRAFEYLQTFVKPRDKSNQETYL